MKKLFTNITKDSILNETNKQTTKRRFSHDGQELLWNVRTLIVGGMWVVSGSDWQKEHPYYVCLKLDQTRICNYSWWRCHPMEKNMICSCVGLIIYVEATTATLAWCVLTIHSIISLKDSSPSTRSNPQRMIGQWTPMWMALLLRAACSKEQKVCKVASWSQKVVQPFNLQRTS